MKFLIKNEYDVISPEKLELAKIPPREVAHLGEEDVEKILNMPHQMLKNPLAIARDEAILRFLYGTGLRVSELTHLTRTQIRSDSKQFSVVGKGSKLRSVFMTSQAKDKLIQYLKLRTDDGDYLFVSMSGNSLGNKLSRNAIEELVKKYALAAGIKKKVSPHTLRHSFATTLLKK